MPDIAHLKADFDAKLNSSNIVISNKIKQIRGWKETQQEVGGNISVCVLDLLL